MHRFWLSLIVLLTLSASTHAQVFRCIDTDGNAAFSDTPCGENAESIQIRDNHTGGRFDQNLPATKSEARKPQEKTEGAPEPDTCRFINSTDLRRYLIRGQVVDGMTRKHVRRAFGEPPETHSGPQEVWVYQTRYHGALYELTYVYFTDGCVDRVVYRKP